MRRLLVGGLWLILVAGLVLPSGTRPQAAQEEKTASELRIIYIAGAKFASDDPTSRQTGILLRNFVKEVSFYQALHIADGAMAFLSTTPDDKIPMDFFLIAGQRDPQIKNITQKDQVLVISLEGFKHLKKNCMISFGFANVGIRDDNHFIIQVNSTDKRLHKLPNFPSVLKICRFHRSKA